MSRKLTTFRAHSLACDCCGNHSLWQVGIEQCLYCGTGVDVRDPATWTSWYVGEDGRVHGPFADHEEAATHNNHRHRMSATKQELAPEETQELLQEVEQAETKDLAARIQEAQALAWDQGLRHGTGGWPSHVQATARKDNPFRKESPF